MESCVVGTEGSIVIHPPYFGCSSATLKAGNREEQIHLEPAGARGYGYQITEVMKCLHAGMTESAAMPLDETREIVATMDRLRQRWGLVYPLE